MKVYRDCINGVPPFDNPAFMTIFKADGTVFTTMNVAITSSMTVPPSNNSPCAPTTAGSACVEEAIYVTTVNLPPLNGGYYIAYQRCCRNSTILNLVNPGAVGTTYWEHIPGPDQVAVNSSPRFSFRPPIYVCKGIPINFNHVASDPDGDSLVYSLCTPFNGLDQCCPIVQAGTTSSCGTGLCPTVNSAPPYPSVPFSPAYSASYPMASNPAININPQTGLLNGNPTILGQWVVGVCVSEYRHGVLIGTHHRDFQFNVIACPYIVIADIVSQTSTNNGQGTGFCNGFTISYYNNSFNGTTYFWDFGDPTTTLDTSSAYNPTYTYSVVGTYTVTLIVNPGSPCSDTATEVFHVAPLLLPDFLAPTAQCFNGNQFNFNGGGSFQGNGTFNWNFGTNATPPSASTPSVTNVSFNSPGIYPVVFTVSENGCTVSVTDTIEVYQNPNAAIGNPPTSGCAPLTVTFLNGSSGGPNLSYLWSFSDGTTSTALTPVKTFTLPGVYSVSLTTISSQYCIDTSNVVAVNSLTVMSNPVAQFSAVSSTGQCFNGHSINFTNTSVSSGPVNYNWNLGANSSPSTATTTDVNNVTYSQPGVYIVTLIADESGCKDTTSQFIELYANPQAAIDNFPTSGCTPFTVNFNNLSTAGNPMSFLWSFSDGTSSSNTNPVKTFSVEGVYTVSLTASTAVGCIDTSSVTAVNSITVTETPQAQFSLISATGLCFDNNTCNFTNTSTFFGNVIHTWNFGANATPQSSSALSVSNVVFGAPGLQTITLTEDKNGCISTYTATVELYQNPVADLGTYPLEGCDPLTVAFNNQSSSASMLNYLWEFSDGTKSIDVNPVKVFSPPGVYNFSLTVISNQNCIDTSQVFSVNSITVNPSPMADFVVTPSVTTIFDPEVNLLNNIPISSENIVSWYYDFGDGYSSSDINAFHVYGNIGTYTVSQTVTNGFGCPNTKKLLVKILPEFRFWIPNAFTPDKDGLNDVFKPVIIGAEDYNFLIFDRWGAQIFQTDDQNLGWDGRYKDGDCTDDVYIWKCDFKNVVTKDHEYHVGHVMLVR